MSNEETKPEDTTSPQPAAAPPPGSMLVPVYGNDDRNVNAFSSSAAFAVGQRMARALSESTLVPAEYRGNIPNVMIAMELANRIGGDVGTLAASVDLASVYGSENFVATTVNKSGILDTVVA